jgi:hypothetical protein
VARGAPEGRIGHRAASFACRHQSGAASPDYRFARDEQQARPDARAAALACWRSAGSASRERPSGAGEVAPHPDADCAEGPPFRVVRVLRQRGTPQREVEPWNTYQYGHSGSDPSNAAIRTVCSMASSAETRKTATPSTVGSTSGALDNSMYSTRSAAS